MLLSLALAGCATSAVEPEPVVVEPDPVTEIPAPALSKRPVVHTKTRPRVAEAPLAISVVLTSRSPAYEQIANELSKYFGEFPVYDLSDKSQPPVSAFRVINDSDVDAVVSVGLRATQSSVAMSNAPVVFSQVFNYEDNGLLTDRSRGVVSYAPPRLQLAEWKRIDPAIARIGMIIGEGHDDLVTEAQLAAQQHGIELHVITAHSDQESMYLFRRLVRKIDGFWLIPDNRVLSQRVLEEILDESQRHNVQVLVPNDAMLSMGASISMTTVAADIARQIHTIVQQIRKHGLASVAAISQLSEMNVLVNDALQGRHTVAESGK